MGKDHDNIVSFVGSNPSAERASLGCAVRFTCVQMMPTRWMFSQGREQCSRRVALHLAMQGFELLTLKTYLAVAGVITITMSPLLNGHLWGLLSLRSSACRRFPSPSALAASFILSMACRNLVSYIAKATCQAADVETKQLHCCRSCCDSRASDIQMMLGVSEILSRCGVWEDPIRRKDLPYAQVLLSLCPQRQVSCFRILSWKSPAEHARPVSDTGIRET